VSFPIPALSSLDVDADPKGCCARLYESEAAHWLLDGEMHPGGERLTRRLAALAGVARGTRVVDVACGAGGSVRLLARELDAEAVGVDLGAALLARARRTANEAGLGDRVRFVLGDAEALPLPDASFDVALSECSLCVFPDKRLALAEMARVVRPGGVLAIADVTAAPAALPPELRSAVARVACVADARTEEEYTTLLGGAGCEIVAVERREPELIALIDRVGARLRVARMLAAPGDQRELARAAVRWAGMARTEVGRGTLGYSLIVARTGAHEAAERHGGTHRHPESAGSGGGRQPRSR
jgi:arsenite methyltransferase